MNPTRQTKNATNPPARSRVQIGRREIPQNRNLDNSGPLDLPPPRPPGLSNVTAPQPERLQRPQALMGRQRAIPAPLATPTFDPANSIATVYAPSPWYNRAPGLQSPLTDAESQALLEAVRRRAARARSASYGIYCPTTVREAYEIFAWIQGTDKRSKIVKALRRVVENENLDGFLNERCRIALLEAIEHELARFPRTKRAADLRTLAEALVDGPDAGTPGTRSFRERPRDSVEALALALCQANAQDPDALVSLFNNHDLHQLRQASRHHVATMDNHTPLSLAGNPVLRDAWPAFYGKIAPQGSTFADFRKLYVDNRANALAATCAGERSIADFCRLYGRSVTFSEAYAWVNQGVLDAATFLGRYLVDADGTLRCTLEQLAFDWVQKNRLPVEAYVRHFQARAVTGSPEAQRFYQHMQELLLEGHLDLADYHQLMGAPPSHVLQLTWLQRHSGSAVEHLDLAEQETWCSAAVHERWHQHLPEDQEKRFVDHALRSKLPLADVRRWYPRVESWCVLEYDHDPLDVAIAFDDASLAVNPEYRIPKSAALRAFPELLGTEKNLREALRVAPFLSMEEAYALFPDIAESCAAQVVKRLGRFDIDPERRRESFVRVFGPTWSPLQLAERMRECNLSIDVSVRALGWERLLGLNLPSGVILTIPAELMPAERNLLRRLKAQVDASEEELSDGVDEYAKRFGSVDGRTDISAAASRCLFERWTPDLPLPDYFVQFAGRAADVNVLQNSLHQMGLVGPRDKTMAFLQRILASHVQQKTSQLVPTFAAAEPGAVDANAEPFECTVCMEETAPSQAAAHGGRPCPDMVCQTCLQDWQSSGGIERLVGGHCMNVAGHCDSVSLIEDMVGNISAERAAALALHVLEYSIYSQPEWTECKTPNCVGGLDLAKGNVRRLDCVGCGQSSQLGSSSIDLARLRTHVESLSRRDQRDLKKRGIDVSTDDLLHAAGERILLLLRGLSDRRTGGNPGPTRECFHCAAPTEKIDACAYMNCPACHNAFDWNVGHPGHHNFDAGVQEYVAPGVLHFLGLVQGIPPGTCDQELRRRLNQLQHNTLADLATARAVELGLLKNAAALGDEIPDADVGFDFAPDPFVPWGNNRGWW